MRMIACILTIAVSIAAHDVCAQQAHDHHKMPDHASPFVPNEGAARSPRFLPEFFTRRFQSKPIQARDERRFSWWGYRHRELHERGIIDELLEKTKGKSCCNGVDSGECRITRYAEGAGNRMVIIDDLPCPITDDTRIVPLQSFNEQGLVVVCAGQTDFGRRPRSCPSTYCIGTVGGI